MPIGTTLGSILILLGVLVWPVYVYAEAQSVEEIAVLPYLTAHLALVIPGALLGGRGLIRRLLSRSKENAE
ncbi:MAG: hypothetical protein HYX86_02275 [Chloroflexi bacterium]|nr:hypothetical protein [Chloroflexota bacterium]